MIDGWDNPGGARWAAVGTSVPARGCAARADRPLAVVAQREGEVVVSRCAGCTGYERLLGAFATSVALTGPPGAIALRRRPGHALPAVGRVFPPRGAASPASRSWRRSGREAVDAAGPGW